MTVNVENMKRVFKYNNMKLEDPDIKKSPEEVKEFYATTLYPELTQSVIEGPNYDGSTILYSFAKSVGTKGGELVINQSITLERLAKKGFAGYIENHKERKEEKWLTQRDFNQIHSILSREGTMILTHGSSLPLLP
ncbi:MAG: PRTRC system protein C [Nitrospiria bacterium]